MNNDLNTLLDDITAFVEGLGMRRFPGYVPDEMTSVVWEGSDHADGWKDFVELAKGSGAPFLTVNSVTLQRADLDYLIHRLERMNCPDEDDIEEARWLRTYLGKTGYIQLGFPYQGIMFVCEVSCEWYERYQRLLDQADEFSGITFDESDLDDEH